MKRKKIIIAIAVLTAFLASWAAAPWIIGKAVRSKAEERGWNVRFKSMEWAPGRVDLRGVHAESGWAKADLASVSLILDGTELKAVTASDGSVEADLSKRPAGSGRSEGNVRTIARGLSILATGVCGSGKVVASGVSKDDAGVRAEKAFAKCRGWVAEAEGVSRDKEGAVTADRVSVKRLPQEYEGPASTTGGEQRVGLESIPRFSVHIGELEAEDGDKVVRASQLQAYTLEGGPDVNVLADHVLMTTPELGDLTLVKPSAGLRRKGETGSQVALVDLFAKSVGTELGAMSKEETVAKSIHVTGELDVELLRQGTIQAEAVTLGVGRFLASGNVMFKDLKNMKVDLNAMKTDCQEAVDSSPSVFADKISGFRFSGTLQPEVHVEAKDGKFDVSLKIANKCKVESAPAAMSVKTFSKRFVRTVPGAKGDIEVESGPGTAAWIPLQRVSPYMVKAVLTCEDSAFFQHRGFVEKAIENSMKANLESGKFSRGGSTVSMQLAKNLWLSRTKTLSRKYQELFLTTYLEQSLTKDEIMELYLNSIEFGPDLYGIGPASLHYFSKAPKDLTLAEAVFLATILPSPKRERFDKDGKIDAGWDKYVRRIVRVMRERDLISDHEAEEGLTQEVKKGGDYVPRDWQPLGAEPEGLDPSTWK